MKYIFILGLLVVASACGRVADSPVRILEARVIQPGEPGEDCELSELQRFAGSLDIAASISYFVFFHTENDLQEINTVVGGENIADSDRNIFIGKEILFTYTAPNMTFEQERLPVHYPIKPQTDDEENGIFIDLITNKAATNLLANVTTADVVQVDVGFEITGELASGQRVRTNFVHFPITVFNSGFAGCAANDRAAPTGPCGLPGGQDGSFVGCCATNPTLEVCQ